MSSYFRIDEQGRIVAPGEAELGYFKSGTRLVRAAQSLLTQGSTKLVTESVKQHKYSRLAMASYYYKNQTKVGSILNKMQETRGFRLDTTLSTVEHSIFHNPETLETVIAFRGTSNLKDVGTDAMVLSSQELRSNRLRDSERVFEATAEKYGKENLVTTGHSLGGHLSLHTAERYDVDGHHFNPAVSARQADQSYTSALRDNTARQTVYRTHGDAVSVGGELAEAPLSNRDLIRVHVHPENTSDLVAHHQLNNFYSDNAVREGGMLRTEKASLLTTGLDTLDRTLTVAQLGYGVYHTIEGVNRDEDPEAYSHQVSQDFDPLMGLNIDPSFQWTDSEVATPLFRAGQSLRSTERRKQDERLAVEDRIASIPKGQYTQTGSRTLVNKDGVRYVQVSP
jgi:hypothetical protein